MKLYIFKLKQKHLQCPECILNIIKAFACLKNIIEFSIDVDMKRILIKHNDEKLSRGFLKNLIDNAAKTCNSVV